MRPAGPLRIPRKSTRVLAFLAIFACFPLQLGAQTPAAAPSASALSLEEYISELDRASQVVQDSSKDTAALRDFRASLPDSWAVEANGNRFTVDTAWLRDALDSLEKNPPARATVESDAERQLAEMRAAAREMGARNEAENNGAARARLDQILSAREFRGPAGPSWWDVWKARILAWITRQLAKFFRHLGVSRAMGNWIAWSMIIIAALLLAAWAVRLAKRSGRDPRLDLRGAQTVGRDWRRWLDEAASAAKRGDYRAAIHAAYWAAVSRLEETNLLPEDRSRTPRESLRILKRESPEHAPLSRLTRCFELVWYGNREAKPADWSDAMEQLEKIGCPVTSMQATAGS